MFVIWKSILIVANLFPTIEILFCSYMPGRIQ